ncbi:MAG: MAPEG family protein [Halioglobus sp.]|nr:MAPEG family protein [Halioglobus sp.]
MTFALWTILFVILLPLPLALVADVCRYREFGEFDNNNPREQSARLSGLGARAWAAQQNTWEAVAVYTPSVIVAHIAGVDPAHMTTTALLFCVARVLHSAFYLLDWGTPRSLIYFVSLGCCLNFFRLAAGAA